MLSPIMQINDFLSNLRSKIIFIHQNFKRNLLTLIVMLSLLFSPTYLKGSAFGEENILLSAQVELLAEIAMSETIRNSMYTADIIPRAVQTVKILNQTLSAARESIRIYRAIKERKWEDWWGDVKTGIKKALPELGELENEIKDFEGNVDSIANSRFIHYKSRLDKKTLTFINRFGTEWQKGVLHQKLFPKTVKYEGIKAKPVDQIILDSYIKSGLQKELNADLIRKRMFSRYMSQYEEQAKENNNLNAQIEADQNQILYEMLGSTEDIKRMSKIMFAEKENLRQEREIKKYQSDKDYKNSVKDKENIFNFKFSPNLEE